MNYLILFTFIFCLLESFVFSRNIYYQQKLSFPKEQYYKYPTYNNNQLYNYKQNYYRQPYYYQQQQYNQQGYYSTVNQQYANYYNPALANTRGLNFKRGYIPFNQMRIGEAYGDELAQYWIICHTCPKGK